MTANEMPRSETPPRLLIVEDDPRWRTLYTEILEEAGYALQFAVSYGEARGWLQRESFALAIVDLHLTSSIDRPDNRDGLRLLQGARQRGLPSLVVSALGDPEEIDRAYDELGVFAFIEKEALDRSALPDIVADAIRSADPEAGAEGQAAADRLPEDLTDREREVLMLLTRGYTNRQIAEALLITTNTVKKHVDHVLQKLGVSNRAAAVAAVLRSGPPAEPPAPAHG